MTTQLTDEQIDALVNAVTDANPTANCETWSRLIARSTIAADRAQRGPDELESLRAESEMSRELLQQARRFIVLSTADSPELEAQKPRLLADIDAELIKPERKHTEAEVQERLRQIAHLTGTIFCYGNFVAETHNEAVLEKLLRENGTFWDSVEQYEKSQGWIP